MSPNPGGRPTPDPPAEAPDRVAAAGVAIAVMIVVGACWFREPGGPGLSPLAAGLALAGIALVLRYLGLGWLGCFGTLVVLAAAAQVMLAGAGARRRRPAPATGRSHAGQADNRGSGSRWDADRGRRPAARRASTATLDLGRRTSRPGLQSSTPAGPASGTRVETPGTGRGA
jgi:hypothetical protein